MSFASRLGRKIRCKVCRCVLASSDDLLGHGLVNVLLPSEKASGSEYHEKVRPVDNVEETILSREEEAQGTITELPHKPLTSEELASKKESSASSGSLAQSPISEFSENWRPSMINVLCSGYFLDPTSLKWIESLIQEGYSAGKITCPNQKCRSKLGNYDWAGVCCSCKEWVTPAFCISRSKVDETLV